MFPSSHLTARVPYLGWSVDFIQRVFELPSIDSYNNNKKFGGQKKVHRLKHIDHTFWRTTVQIVDIENDSVNSFLTVGSPIPKQFFKFLKIPSNGSDHPQVFLVFFVTIFIDQEIVNQAASLYSVELLFRLFLGSPWPSH